MSTSTQLQQIIDDALATIRKSSQHDLPLGYRRAIYVAFGKRRDTVEDSVITVGHKRRTLLAIRSARQVLPLWEVARPLDRTPHRFLEVAEAVLHESVSEVTVDQIFQDLEEGPWGYMETISYIAHRDNLPNPSFSYAGFSAAQALGVARYDEFFESLQVDYTLTDSDVDEHEEDTAFYAVYAAAGGPSGSTEADPIKRHAFWEWWLTEGVPTAWMAFSDF